MHYQTGSQLEDIQHLIILKPTETVHLITRQHIIFFFLKTLLAVLSISLIALMGATIGALPGVGSLVSIFWAIGYFLIGVIVLTYTVQFHNYYLSKQIITNSRSIDYDQRGLFRAEINETFLVNVENINVIQTNFWQTVFNFGNVDVQTAGQKTEITTSGVVFENIPNPKGAAAILSDLTESAKQGRNTDQ